MIAGSVISFSFIFRHAGRMHMAVFLNAFSRGQYVGDWKCFSHFKADARTRIIYLFAAQSPNIVRVAWHPTTDEIFNDVLGVLRNVLPERVQEKVTPWYRSPWGLIGAILLLVLPIIIAAVVIFLSSATWGWIYYTVAVPVLMIVGISLVRKLELN
jgi:hypothetical protein